MKSAPLSEQVKKARADARLTQLEVAVRSGVSLTVVRNIEQGITKDPRHSTVEAIFRALDHEEQAATHAGSRGEVAHDQARPVASRR